MRVTEKGQVTIPKDIRDRLNIGPGSEVDFVADEKGARLIVVAGGKKLPIPEALSMAYHAISEGAHGMDMGRNIFQAEDPKAMAQAVAKIVHEGFTDKEAYEFYRDTACVK